jgi:hypothetical protein
MSIKDLVVKTLRVNLYSTFFMGSMTTTWSTVCLLKSPVQFKHMSFCLGTPSPFSLHFTSSFFMVLRFFLVFYFVFNNKRKNCKITTAMFSGPPRLREGDPTFRHRDRLSASSPPATGPKHFKVAADSNRQEEEDVDSTFNWNSFVAKWRREKEKEKAEEVKEMQEVGMGYDGYGKGFGKGWKSKRIWPSDATREFAARVFVDACERGWPKEEETNVVVAGGMVFIYLCALNL